MPVKDIANVKVGGWSVQFCLSEPDGTEYAARARKPLWMLFAYPPTRSRSEVVTSMSETFWDGELIAYKAFVAWLDPKELVRRYKAKIKGLREKNRAERMAAAATARRINPFMPAFTDVAIGNRFLGAVQVIGFAHWKAIQEKYSEI